MSQRRVIRTVREKFTCRQCEALIRPPAPFHVKLRGRMGLSLLATILLEKFGQHQPLNRQSERYAREGIDLSVSTLVDQVGAATAAYKPLHELIAWNVMAAERLCADDTTVPILSKGKSDTDRIWTCARRLPIRRRRSADGPLLRLARHAAGASGTRLSQAARASSGPMLPAVTTDCIIPLGPTNRSPRTLLVTCQERFLRTRGIAKSDGAGRALHRCCRRPGGHEVHRCSIRHRTPVNGLSAKEHRDTRQEQSRPIIDDLYVWPGARRLKLSRPTWQPSRSTTR